MADQLILGCCVIISSLVNVLSTVCETFLSCFLKDRRSGDVSHVSYSNLRGRRCGKESFARSIYLLNSVSCFIFGGLISAKAWVGKRERVLARALSDHVKTSTCGQMDQGRSVGGTESSEFQHYLCLINRPDHGLVQVDGWLTRPTVAGLESTLSYIFIVKTV